MTDVTLQQPLDIAEADKQLRALASEVACGSFDLEVILNSHRITLEQFKRLERTPRFQNLLREALANWNSTANTKERTQAKAALAVEDLLPVMYANANNKSEPLSSRVELFKALMKAGGIGEKAAGSGGDTGEKFSVTINLGDGKDLKIERELPSKVIEGELL
jgi:hypothetical protein